MRLPPTLRKIADVVGEDLALKISEKYGGRRLYFTVPENIALDHPLVAVVGFDAALRLATTFRRKRFDIPKAVMVARDRRNEEIIAARALGLSKSEIALAHQISMGTVRWIVALNARKSAV